MSMTKTMVAQTLALAALGSLNLTPASSPWGSTAPDRGKVGTKRKKKAKTFGKNKRK